MIERIIILFLLRIFITIVVVFIILSVVIPRVISITTHSIGCRGN
jgi:hypothetical protein